MAKIELLAPVGNLDCLKVAVQNGADSVYLGASNFNARYSADNFSISELKEAIIYAKLRNVKVHLTVNILIKNNEYEEAINLVKEAYILGIDAVIVQDLGLAKELIKLFPDLPVHASTQMTVHNLEGVKELQNLGFKRCILSRELPISEIEYICKNSFIEIETFIHGALCICYSGQCLFSSIVGGRSGNRGKCAQPCRLPYKLVSSESNKCIDSGHLLSTKDLCGLEYIPSLISAGVSSLKIEGRMKSPTYVATVTRIYRKYIDLAYSNEDYIIDNKDIKDLMQVFNRGGSSTGHLSDSPNTSIIFKEKPNNMGLYLGKIINYNPNKGLISLKCEENISIGDSISIENEEGLYTISELMKNNQNIKSATPGDIIKFGRMKGNININDKVYKMTDLELVNKANSSYKTENKKIHLSCNIAIKRSSPISLSIDADNDLKVDIVSDIIPETALNKPITLDRIKEQLSKTNNTIFEFDEINVDMDDNLFIPHISSLNELRRNALQKLEELLISKIRRKFSKDISIVSPTNENISNEKNISVLLNTIDKSDDYSLLSNKINNIYIPFNYFILKDYTNIINLLCDNHNLYVYMPNIIRKNYMNVVQNNLDSIVNSFKIKGFVLSNISDFETLARYKEKYDFIANFTLNAYNFETIKIYSTLGAKKIILNPELDKNIMNNLIKTSDLPIEIIVYGQTPLMVMNYCPLGKSNKCYNNCEKYCSSKNEYYLRDRKNLDFRIIIDNSQTITTIYNSKILSLDTNEFCNNNFRIDILDEDISKINEITTNVLNNKLYSGYEYTSGNLNKDI